MRREGFRCFTTGAGTSGRRIPKAGPWENRGQAAEIEIPEGVRRIRLDPGEAAGGLSMSGSSAMKTAEKRRLPPTGFLWAAEHITSAAEIPQFILEKIPAGARKLQIEIEIMKEPEAEEAFWRSLSRVSAEKDAEIAALKEKIRQMENTKVWKLYRSLKK